MFRGDVIASAQPGDPLSPSLVSKNINRLLRAVFKKIALPCAEKYSSHCFRRWAASAILNAGPKHAEIMQTDGWGSSSFRVYLDIQGAGDVSTRAVLDGGDPHSPTASGGDETSLSTNTSLENPETLKLYLFFLILQRGYPNFQKILKPYFRRWDYSEFGKKTL